MADPAGEPADGTAGQRLFARYAYAPNHLGYCGPADSAALLDLAATGQTADGQTADGQTADGQTADGQTADGIEAIAARFSGAWPYLCVLAELAGLDDPLDERIVRAYWTGSALLDEVNRQRFWRTLLARIAAAGAGRYWAHLTPALLSEAMPTHAFHVFGVYPWTRLLTAGGSAATSPALHVLDSCRIRWGRVLAVDEDHAMISGRRLTWDGRALRLGEESEDAVRLTVAAAGGDRRFAAEVSPGDWLAVHWDLACERLTAEQLWQLRRWTDWQLVATNVRLAREADALSAASW